MSKAAPEIKQLAVDAPIQNSPYEEPTRYWKYEGREPVLVEGLRREAGYYFRPRTRGPKGQMSLLADEQFVPLELVNRLRGRVAEWRKQNYRGATPVTRRLLEHWGDPNREPRLFFCQREAVETIIWLTEINGKDGPRLSVPLDEVADTEGIRRGYKPLRRRACKMATGSGKTVVMAMVAAWTWLNKAHYPKDRRFSDAILVVCPGLTIRERLQVLRPGSPGNYYDKFGLIPPGMGDLLGRGKIRITNWHEFLLRDDGKSRRVVQRGVEPDDVFAERVLKDLGSARNILVFNDEAHHAYRPPTLTPEQAEELTAEERQEEEEATVWVQGLDRINAMRGINFCLDLSATPFYIGGSRHEEGTPFPWVVSDFGLVDAIESGLVKIPRVPVASNTGRAIPEFFNLWRWINEKLKEEDPASAGTGRRGPKPEAVLREADGALQQLAGLWKATFDDFAVEGRPVPPAMIVVCDNTALSQVFHEHISGERTVTIEGEDGKKRKTTVYNPGQVFPELLSNTAGYQPTMRIDSRLIKEAEAEGDGKSRGAAGEELRHRVSTVGKEGEPGEDVRCVVSVAMLTEGWDANNVTQILGLRAFDSQLLCEQVVGRALRRISYDVDRDTGLLREEDADVYGVPFEVIPVKKKPSGPTPPPPPKFLVRALEERAALAIEFPLVEGYVYEVTDRIRADLEAAPRIVVDPQAQPTEVISRPKVWVEGGPPSLVGPGGTVTQTRAEYYATVRMQTIEFDLARRITQALIGTSEQDGQPGFRRRAAHVLFPQVVAVVRQFLAKRVDYSGIDPKEIGLEYYRKQVEERLLAVIEPDEESRETSLLPRVERFRPVGTTGDVIFSTSRPVRATLHSHISHVVLDSITWEGSAAFHLEAAAAAGVVQTYAKNDHLGFVIPYDWGDKPHAYIPDYLVRLRNGVTLILEIKGQEREQDRQKYAAAGRWVSAVNNAGQWGTWAFVVCKEMATLPAVLKEWAATDCGAVARAVVPDRANGNKNEGNG